MAEYTPLEMVSNLDYIGEIDPYIKGQEVIFSVGLKRNLIGVIFDVLITASGWEYGIKETGRNRTHYVEHYDIRKAA